MTLKSLDAEMRRQFHEVHSRVDILGSRIEAMDRKFDDRLDTVSTELRSMRETMDSKFGHIDSKFGHIDGKFGNIDRQYERIDDQFSRITPDLVKALSPWMINIENMLDDQSKRITAIESKNSI